MLLEAPCCLMDVRDKTSTDKTRL